MKLFTLCAVLFVVLSIEASHELEHSDLLRDKITLETLSRRKFAEQQKRKDRDVVLDYLNTKSSGKLKRNTDESSTKRNDQEETGETSTKKQARSLSMRNKRDDSPVALPTKNYITNILSQSNFRSRNSKSPVKAYSLNPPSKISPERYSLKKSSVISPKRYYSDNPSYLSSQEYFRNVPSQKLNGNGNQFRPQTNVFRDKFFILPFPSGKHAILPPQNLGGGLIGLFTPSRLFESERNQNIILENLPKERQKDKGISDQRSDNQQEENTRMPEESHQSGISIETGLRDTDLDNENELKLSHQTDIPNEDVLENESMLNKNKVNEISIEDTLMKQDQDSKNIQKANEINTEESTLDESERMHYEEEKENILMGKNEDEPSFEDILVDELLKNTDFPVRATLLFEFLIGERLNKNRIVDTIGKNTASLVFNFPKGIEEVPNILNESEEKIVFGEKDLVSDNQNTDEMPYITEKIEISLKDSFPDKSPSDGSHDNKTPLEKNHQLDSYKNKLSVESSLTHEDSEGDTTLEEIMPNGSYKDQTPPEESMPNKSYEGETPLEESMSNESYEVKTPPEESMQNESYGDETLVEEIMPNGSYEGETPIKESKLNKNSGEETPVEENIPHEIYEGATLQEENLLNNNHEEKVKLEGSMPHTSYEEEAHLKESMPHKSYANKTSLEESMLHKNFDVGNYF